MAEKDDGPGERPSLEMPTLGGMLRRKRKGPATTDDAEAAAERAPATAPEAEAVTAETPAVVPPEPDPEPSPERAPEAAAPADDEPTEVIAHPATASAPTTEPAAPAEPAPSGAEYAAAPPLFADEVQGEVQGEVDGEAEGEATTPTAVQPAATGPVPPAPAAAPVAPAAASAPATSVRTTDVPTDEGAGDAEPHRAGRRGLRLPPLPGRVAAAVTGLAVGLLAVVATVLVLAGCEAVRGTSSCGGGPGFFLLLAIIVVLVVAGSALLRAWQVPDPTSTSVLGVGLLVVVVLLFLIDAAFSPWMLVVVPLVTAGGYALSHWVTTSFVDEG